MRNSNNCKTLTGIHFALGIYIHDVIRDVEGKKERKTPEAMEKWKMRVASGGIRTHNTLYMYMYKINNILHFNVFSFGASL